MNGRSPDSIQPSVAYLEMAMRKFAPLLLENSLYLPIWERLECELAIAIPREEGDLVAAASARLDMERRIPGVGTLTD